MAKPQDKGPFVAIPASLGGIYLIITAMFLIFANDQLSHLVSIAWAFVVLGVGAVFFAYLASLKK